MLLVPFARDRPDPKGSQSMIRKSGHRFSEKIMLKQKDDRRA